MIAKSAHGERIAENAKIVALALSDQDMLATVRSTVRPAPTVHSNISGGEATAPRRKAPADQAAASTDKISRSRIRTSVSR